MRTLNNISIEGYKSIRKCHDLKFRQLNILIGANGSGKSKLLSFFELLNAAARGEFQVYVGRNGAAHSLLNFGPKQTAEMVAYLQFDTEDKSAFYNPRFLYAAPDNLIFASEKFSITPKGQMLSGLY